MKIKKLLSGFALLLSLSANATIIKFEGNDIRDTGVHLEDDYSINVQVDKANGTFKAPQHLLDAGFSGDFMETWTSEAVFTLSQVNGQLFDIAGLDVGSYYSANSGLSRWNIKGYRDAIESFSFANMEFLGRVDLDWYNLTNLTIQSVRGGADSFDNIELYNSNVANPVNIKLPEPTPFAFFSLAGIILFIRRKQLKLDPRNK
jgi:hypothetical protein